MKEYIHKQILLLANEEDGIWDLVSFISQKYEVLRLEAFEKIQKEIDYLIEREDIYFLKSEKLYDPKTCQVINKKELLNLTLDDVEFREEGPFYYLSFFDTFEEPIPIKNPV